MIMRLMIPDQRSVMSDSECRSGCCNQADVRFGRCECVEGGKEMETREKGHEVDLVLEPGNAVNAHCEEYTIENELTIGMDWHQ